MNIEHIKTIVRELVWLYVISWLWYILFDVWNEYNLLNDYKFLAIFCSTISFLVVPATYLVSKASIDKWLSTKTDIQFWVIFLCILLLISFTISLKTYAI